MNLYEYLRDAEKYAFQNHIRANSVLLNERIALIHSGFIRIDSYSCKNAPPMICGLAAHLTDELPDDVAFAIFESPYAPFTREEKIKAEYLAELRKLSVDELIEKVYGISLKEDEG